MSYFFEKAKHNCLIKTVFFYGTPTQCSFLNFGLLRDARVEGLFMPESHRLSQVPPWEGEGLPQSCLKPLTNNAIQHNPNHNKYHNRKQHTHYHPSTSTQAPTSLHGPASQSKKSQIQPHLRQYFIFNTILLLHKTIFFVF